MCKLCEILKSRKSSLCTLVLYFLKYTTNRKCVVTVQKTDINFLWKSLFSVLWVPLVPKCWFKKFVCLFVLSIWHGKSDRKGLGKKFYCSLSLSLSLYRTACTTLCHSTKSTHSGWLLKQCFIVLWKSNNNFIKQLTLDSLF